MTNSATTNGSVWDALTTHLREAALIGSVDALVGYDEQTVMPPAAAEYRGEQSAWLGGVLHDKLTDPRLGEWLEELARDGDPDPAGDRATVVREARRDFRRRTCLSKALVEELARTKSSAQQAWIAARKQSDFKMFAPQLEKMLRLKREEADALMGILREETPATPIARYDALLDQYEPGARIGEIHGVLENLRAELVPLIRELSERGTPPDASPLSRHFPRAAQQAFGTETAARIGFDFESGRLDVTTHPFCSEMGPYDVRITTRYNENAINESFFGILHEAGHGLYEQGLPAAWYGMGPGQYSSLGIHESQSRLWENLVGRSRAFWDYAMPRAQAYFPTLADLDAESFYRAANRVQSSFIRVEADEATYNLHIMIRFELEQALLNDELPVADLPGVWNERYRRDLGISPPNDAQGVLQDVHWSAGLLGYFPTYTLGNLYASQLFAAAGRALGDLNEQFRRGDFAPLLEWLRANVHQHGRRYSASALIEKATGETLNPAYLLGHLREKFGRVYGLKS